MPIKNISLVLRLLMLTLALPSFALLCLPAAAQEEPQVPMASLPLEEVLRLYKENEETRKEEDVDPPFAATVHKIELAGRLLEEALELKATFEVVVLAQDEWVSIPLLRRGASTTLSQLPRIDDVSPPRAPQGDEAVFAVDKNQLSLVTKHSGTYRFEISFLEKARVEGRRRTASVVYGEAAVARLVLQVDEGLFRIENAVTAPQGGGKVIYPENGRFDVTWEPVADLPGPKAVDAPRPPIESVVTSAHGSVVSTLEGKSILRLLYDLRFEGARPFTLRLPEGPTLERVYLNRVPIPFTVEGGQLELQVEPRRAGDQNGRLEIVLESDQGGYNLSGDLFYELPRVSWPVNELFLDLHLPKVFNYTWTGGSLSPVQPSPEMAYTYEIPRPGKRLSFHQYLISKSAATLRVEYAIDLTEKYFCQR